MKNLIPGIVCSLLLAFTVSVTGQDLLTAEEALQMGIQNNLGLRISRNAEEISRNNASRAAAGQMPFVGLGTTTGYRIQNTQIEFSSPGIEPVDVRGAGTFNFGATVDASFVVFDGFRGQQQYRLLQSGSVLSQLETKLQLEGLVFQILSAYASVQAAGAQVTAARDAVLLSEERLQQTRDALRYGTGTALTVMEAEVALRQDSVQLVSAEQAERIQKRNLNRLLQREPGEAFTVEPGIDLGNGLDRNALLEQSLANNSGLAVFRQQLAGAILNEKIARASLWPTITATASYGYTRQQNDAGLFVSQSALGPSGAIGLSFPIFDGGLRGRQIENARIAQESSELALEDQELQLRLEVENAFDQYQLALEQIEREEANIRLAEAVLQRTKELLDLGQLSQLDFRTAQVNLERSRGVLVQNRLTARLAELELLRLSGSLVR